ncbi:CGNR zinc finger domain-containing protein [Kitasatospora sp. NPDC057223]|uniref:CGNR zinc finger domain-containing protein n=1 Tax=Kitasatospora sp. NPDC057223 TaxID=3346055 RepID=UPI00362C3243
MSGTGSTSSTPGEARPAGLHDPRPLTGEPLSLDLLNTRWSSPVNDLLTGLDGYRIWLASAGLADRCPADEAGLAATLAARSALAALLGPLVAHQPGQGPGGPPVPDPGATAALNDVLRRGRIRRELGAAGPQESVEVDGPEWLAGWLAAADCLDLLRQGPHRIKQCAGHTCILYFFDTSQNGRRRWCSMAACGNRAKAARHYERAKG